MEEHQLYKIDELLLAHDLKKAEMLIIKQLRTEMSQHNRTQLLLRRARVRLQAARPDDALNDLQTIYEIAPLEFNSPAILELLGDCHFVRFEMASLGFADRNDTLLAQQLYERIVRDHPKHSNLGWVHYQLGRLMLTVNDTPRAVLHFHQALLSPSYISFLTAYCYERLAFIEFYENRDLIQSLAFINRAIDTLPSNGDKNWLVQVYILRSRILRGTRDYEQALKASETALALVARNSDNKSAVIEALLTTGELLAEIGNRDREVIQILQQFTQHTKKPLGVDVTWSRVNEMLGNAYFNLRQYDNAINAYKAVLQYNPDYPWDVSLYYRIAISYFYQGAFSDAINVISHMLEIAGAEQQTINDYRVYNVLGDANFALKNYHEASQAYYMALQMAPPNADNLPQIKSHYDLALERL